jgi:hypothetical protein
MKAMLFAVWCALAVPVATGGGAVAQEQKQFKAADYPVAVRKVLSAALLYCRQEGGGKLEFAPDTVQKLDFNGDGRLDYVVDLDKVKCPQMEHIFCGTGGCMTHFLATMPDGTIRELFADVIHRYEVLKGPPMAVRFDIHHSACEDGDPTRGCQKVVRIGYRPFKPRG